MADAARNLSFAVLDFELPALLCVFGVELLTFCFFSDGVVGAEFAVFFPPDLVALRFLEFAKAVLRESCFGRKGSLIEELSLLLFCSALESLLLFSSLYLREASMSDLLSTGLVEMLGLIDEDCESSKG